MRHQYRKWLPVLFIIYCMGPYGLPAQTVQPVRTVPVTGRMMTADELGNIYVIREDNTLIRYNSAGDSTGFYRSVLNGDIGMADVTNPLRILLYYPAYAKVVLLDRMFTEKAEIDLRRRQILQAPAAATASDGRLWIYDPFNARLLKLDENGEIVRSSNDLRQELPFVPDVSFILERDRKVYVCDTTHGLLIFDQFASYINTLPLTGITRLQAFDQQLVYYQHNLLHSYDLKTSGEKTLALPPAAGNVITAAIGPDILAVLYRDKLVIYPAPFKR